MRISIDGGKMDAFDETPGCQAPYRCYSQYVEKDIPNYFSYAKHYLIADNFFSSITGPSYPNHLYSIASQSGGAVQNPHVPPPTVDNYGFGPRVPLIIVSPYARKGQISHTTYEFSSFLKFVERRFGLPALTEPDAKANDMLDSFDFNQPSLPPMFLEEHGCPVASQLRWKIATWRERIVRWSIR